MAFDENKLNQFKSDAVEQGFSQEAIDRFVEHKKKTYKEPESYQVPTLSEAQQSDPNWHQRSPVSQKNDYSTDLSGYQIPGKAGSYPVTQAFGNYNPSVEVFSQGINRGVDIGIPIGTPLKAPNGQWEVVESYSGANPSGGYIGNREGDGYGNSVKIRNTQTGEELKFSHLSRVGVRSGEILTPGKVFALTGHSGNSSGAHLDTEFINANGQLSDALRSPYMREVI